MSARQSSTVNLSSANPGTRWVNVMQFAALMGIARRTAYNWLMAGRLRYRRTANGTVRIDLSSAWADDTGPRTAWDHGGPAYQPRRGSR